MLHQTYEDNEESRINFENDLDIGFFYADGFDERLYRNSYARIERNQFTINHTEIQNFNLNTRDNVEEMVVIDLTLDTTDEEIINENNNSYNEQMPSITSNLSNDSRNGLSPPTISSPNTSGSHNEQTPSTTSSYSRNEQTPSTISSPSINMFEDELFEQTPSTISSSSINMFDDEPNEQTSTPIRNKRGNRSDRNESGQSSSQEWENNNNERSLGRRHDHMESVANDNWHILLPENMENELKRRNKRKK